jgi:hypothetical protein
MKLNTIIFLMMTSLTILLIKFASHFPLMTLIVPMKTGVTTVASSGQHHHRFSLVNMVFLTECVWMCITRRLGGKV